MNLRQKTKRIFTAALAVWMSGIVLAICCQMPSAKAAGAEMESCSLAKKSDCGKSVQEISGEFAKDASQTFDCCALPAKIFDKARKIEVQPPPEIISAAIEIAAPPVFNLQNTFRLPRFHHSFVQNRAEIYLRNCEFRI